MSYLGAFGIDSYVGIPASTHRFSTGGAYEPSALTYSIYEEGNTTGIAEDQSMVPASPWDSIVGCYWVRVQLTALAGYEVGKNYLVVVKATVDGVSAIETHTFQVTETAAKLAYFPDESPMDAAALRTALGLAAANLDTQFAAIPTAAEINDEVKDVLATDTLAEPTTVPAANATAFAKLAWLFLLARNEALQTKTTPTASIKNDSGTVIATSTTSDNGETFTRGKWTNA